MKTTSNMAELFERLTDLKAVFRYGEKLIPIIQSLIDFMRDTVPLLENINTSIADSANKIPKAKNQINDVTSATELATTEILDIVDIISNDISTIENKLTSIQQKNNTERKEISEKLYNILSKNSDALNLLKEYEKLSEVSVTSELVELCKKIKNDAYNITLSLQVQDITSQQLAAVNHLIESVQARLSSLIVDLKDSEPKEASVDFETPLRSTFDPNARYTNNSKHQHRADEIINNEINKASQEEIDRLFHGNGR